MDNIFRVLSQSFSDGGDGADDAGGGADDAAGGAGDGCVCSCVYVCALCPFIQIWNRPYPRNV